MWICFTAHLLMITMCSVIILHSEQWGMCPLLLRPFHWHTVLASTPDFLRGHQFFLLLSFALTTLLYFSRFSHTSPFWLSQPVPATVQRAFTVLFRLVLLSERETDREMEKRNKYSSKFPVSWTRFRFLTERLKGHFTGKWNEFWEAWWCYFWSQRLHWLQSQHVPTFERAGNPPFIF